LASFEETSSPGMKTGDNGCEKIREGGGRGGQEDGEEMN
jgi:hypothetical protein